MTDALFPAYYVDRDSAGQVHGSVQPISKQQLPAGDVLIEVHWSSLNYKDALAAIGHPGVARRLPHVPGIDAAGVIAEIASPDGNESLQVGSEVIVTGYELGAGIFGGWSRFIRVPRAWVVPRPASLSLRDAMALGTAGFTAAQCVSALFLNGIDSNSGDVVVTGATGGVGCIAVMLLAKLGYRVVAVTGKPDQHDRLRGWGAAEVVGREAVIDQGTKPMLPARWAGVVDTVGGATLATLIRQTKDHGCVTACGLVGGTELPLSVYPFILRGVALAGITSSGCLAPQRLEIWTKLAGPWRPADLASCVTEITLQQVGEVVPEILAGKVVGRTVVRIDSDQ